MSVEFPSWCVMLSFFKISGIRLLKFLCKSKSAVKNELIYPIYQLIYHRENVSEDFLMEYYF